MAVLSLLLWGVLAVIVYFVLKIIYTLNKHEKYFKKNGIPYLGAGLLRTAKFFTGSTNMIKAVVEVYQEARETKGTCVGVSDVFGTSNLYIMDMDLLKNVFVKDFDHFINRRQLGSHHDSKYMSRMLFFIENEPWKRIRTKLSPSFTTSKIRKMFESFRKSGERMENYVKAQMEPKATSVDLDMTQIFPKLAMDVIASCAFGIDGKCWDVPPDKKSTFEEMGNKLRFSLKMMIKFMVAMMAPKVLELLGLDVMDHESSTYFSGVIRDVMKKRRQTGERQEDFLQLMMDAQAGLLKEDEESMQVMNGSSEGKLSMTDDTQGKVSFEDDDIIANAMLFLLGGFDTTQSVLIFAIYSLALEQEVQRKLYEEVKLAKDKHGGVLKYEALLEMNYLDMVISETMRMYPPAAITERACTRDYLVPGTNFVIKKDTFVSIPIHPIHHDPRYFPDPEKFIPERFTAEGKATRSPYAFMPFGHGPRNCIAMRFAIVEVKAVIAQLVGSFQFTPCARTPIPVEFDNSDAIRPKGGMCINITPRS